MRLPPADRRPTPLSQNFQMKIATDLYFCCWCLCAEYWMRHRKLETIRTWCLDIEDDPIIFGRQVLDFDLILIGGKPFPSFRIFEIHFLRSRVREWNPPFCIFLIGLVFKVSFLKKSTDSIQSNLALWKGSLPVSLQQSHHRNSFGRWWQDNQFVTSTYPW